MRNITLLDAFSFIPTWRDSIKGIFAVFYLVLLQSCGFTADAVKKDDLKKMTPAQALQRLTEGNDRFNKNSLKTYRLSDQKFYLGKNGAYPPAIVVCSPDSRVAPELIFNQGLGDIFTLRTPASIVTGETLGALEHAARDLGSKVILIMIQTKDPFIEAAIDNNNTGNFTAINYHIRPTLDNIRRDPNWKKWNKEQLLATVTREHLMLMLAKVQNTSAILRGMIERGEITLVGGIYNIETGKISFIKSDE
jgi:carbonic anhydrase